MLQQRPREFWNSRASQYFINFTGLAGIISATVYKDRANFHGSRAWQIVPIINTTCAYIYIYICVCVCIHISLCVICVFQWMWLRLCMYLFSFVFTLMSLLFLPEDRFGLRISWSDRSWHSRSNLTKNSKSTTFWACPHHNSSPVQARITKCGQEVQNCLVKIPIDLG